MEFQNGKAAAALVILFAVMLAGLMFVSIQPAGSGYSFFENRMLAEFPEPDLSGILDGTVFDRIDRYLSDHAPLRETCLEAKTLAEHRVLRKPVVNEVVVLDDCLLPYLGYGVFPYEETESKAVQIARNLAAHRDTAEAAGGHFCFVAVPCQYASLADRYPWYLDNRAEHTEQVRQKLFEALDRYGIEYIDMGERIEKLPMEEQELFVSETDNHFLIRGAWYVYRAIMEKIRNEWGGTPDLLELEDFDLVYLPNEFLGSYRRKLFALVEDDEKLPLLIPKEEIPFAKTQYETEVPSMVYAIPQPEDYATYTVYMGGDIPQMTIKTDRPELPDLLIYGDSFTNAVECIAYTGFNRMDSLDLRYDGKVNLDEYIEQMKPDYVFCIRDYESMLDVTSNGQ